MCFNCLRGGQSDLNVNTNLAYVSETILRFHTKFKTLLQNFHKSLSHQLVDRPEPGNSQPISLNSIVYKSGRNSSFRENRIDILLTTLVDVRDCRGKFVACRLLFDTASELSYITEDCIQSQGLSRIYSKITLSVKAESTRGHGYIHIKSRIPYNFIDAQVHILGRITSPLPRATITASDNKYLKMVQLADPSFHCSNPIDIVLRADYVWDALTQEKLFNDRGKTISISTIFGRLVTSID